MVGVRKPRLPRIGPYRGGYGYAVFCAVTDRLARRRNYHKVGAPYPRLSRDMGFLGKPTALPVYLEDIDGANRGSGGPRGDFYSLLRRCRLARFKAGTSARRNQDDAWKCLAVGALMISGRVLKSVMAHQGHRGVMDVSLRAAHRAAKRKSVRP